MSGVKVIFFDKIEVKGATTRFFCLGKELKDEFCMYNYDMTDDMVIQSMVKIASKEKEVWASLSVQGKSTTLEDEYYEQTSETWWTALSLTNDNKQGEARKGAQGEDVQLVLSRELFNLTHLCARKSIQEDKTFIPKLHSKH